MKVSEIIKEIYINLEREVTEEGESSISLSEKAEHFDDLRDIIFDAHDGLLPNNSVYETVYKIIIHLYDCIDEIRDIENEEEDIQDFLFEELAEIEPEMYTHHLLAWLQSDLSFLYYVQEAIDNGVEDIFDILIQANYLYQQETGEKLINAILEYAEY